MSIFTMTTVTKMNVVVIVNIIIYYLYNSIFIIYIYVYIIKTMVKSQVFSFLSLTQNVDGEQTISARENVPQQEIPEFDSSRDIKYYISKVALDGVTTHDSNEDTYTVNVEELKAALYGGTETILAVNAKLDQLINSRDEIVDALTNGLAELVLEDDLVDLEYLTPENMIAVAMGGRVDKNNQFSVGGNLVITSDSNVLTQELRYLAANDSNRDPNELTPWVIGDLICSFIKESPTTGNFTLNFSEDFTYVNGGDDTGTTGLNGEDASSTRVPPNLRMEQEVSITAGRIWIEVTETNGS